MEKRSRSIFFSWANILTALTAGLIIYLCYGGETYIAGFVRRVLLTGLGQDQLYRFTGGIQRFLRYYGCDMLWSYALVHTFWLFLGRRKKDLYWMCAVSWLFGVALECLQRTGILNGTFDILDMVFEGAAAVAAGLVIGVMLFLKAWRTQERSGVYFAAGNGNDNLRKRERFYEKENSKSIGGFHGDGCIFPDGGGERIRE